VMKRDDGIEKTKKELHERVKELNCLYNISELINKKGLNTEDTLQSVVNYLPEGWQYPGLTCARVVVGEKEFRSENFNNTQWKQEADVLVENQRIGCLEIFYLQKMPEADECPFLGYERKLLNNIAGMLGKYIERKITEEKLRRSEKRFRDIFNNSADSIFIHDLKGNILEVNDVACERLGYCREEMLKLSVLDIDSPDTAHLAFKRIRKIKEEGEYTFEAVHRRKDGSVFPVEVNSRFIEYGDETAVVSIVRDITERKKMEEEMSKAQKLESLGTLAAGIAHDFNNLLMALFGNISLAKMKLPENHPAIEPLNSAEMAMDRATSLSNKLLTFSKGGEPVKKVFNAGELVKDVVELDLSGSNVKAEIEKDDDLWKAEVDKSQFQQVVTGLVVNAKDAMPEGGTLTVKMENVPINDNYVAELEPGNYIKISFSDEGKGIERGNLDKIFDPFFTTKKFGSGLGLSTAYSIMKKHHGCIKVESEPGKGSTFILYLPAADFDDWE